MRAVFLILFSFSFVCTLQAQISVTSTIGTNTATYNTLKESFDAINAGTHQGVIHILVGAAANQIITEVTQPVLNKSGMGNASYSGVYINPAYENITLNASFAGSCCIASGIIQLNGANNVYIDGRVQTNDTTNNLTLENTYTGSSWAAAIVLNGASNNNVQFCTIKSSSGEGTVTFLYNSSLLVGCQNNLIANCIITKSGGNLPMCAIISKSTNGNNSAYKNTNNIIKQCSISDFKRYGIWLGSNSITTHDSAWTIINNHFFQTGTILLDNTNYCNYAVCVGYHDIGGTTFYNGTGAHKINNNVIGGDGSTGNWSINSNSAAAGLFCGGIFFSTNAANYSEISGNEISNYNVSTFVSDQSSLSLAGFNGIYILNSKVKIGSASGNSIHDISLEHKYDSWSGIVSGIYIKNNTDKSCEIKNNSIYNIKAITGSGSFQYFYGIKNGGSSSVYTDQIVNNKIFKINVKLNSNCWGISGFGSISQNHISKLSVQNGTADVTGIQCNGAPAASLANYRVDNNEVIIGADSIGNSTAVNSNIIGINLNSAAYAYYNSVLITGTHSGGTNTTCLKANTSTGNLYTLSNNLFYNNQTGGTGTHYNIITTGSNNFNASNNAYIFDDTGNKLGLWNNATMCNNLSNWAAASGETSSISDTKTNKPVNVFFPQAFQQNENHLFPYTDGWLCKGITTLQQFDFFNNTRNINNPTTIGCFELECSLINASNHVYVFTGNGNWDIANNWQDQSIPPSILPGGDAIIIDPISTGECKLNVTQNINPGGIITVRQNKTFRIPLNLLIQ